MAAYRFKIGDKVRPSKVGIKANVFPKTHQLKSGVVTRTNVWNFPTIRWDGRKTDSTYHPDFVTLDRRLPHSA